MPIPLFFRCLLGAMLLMLATTGRAQIVALDPVIQGQPLGRYLQYHIDESGGLLTLARLPQQAQWQHTTDDIPNFGFTRQVYWFRLDIQAADIQEPWVLQVRYNLMDDVQFYLVDDTGKVISQQQSGMLHPQAGVQRFNRHFLLPLPLEQSGIFTAYIRVRSDLAIQMPVYLWKTSEFVAQDEQHNIVLGMFFGAFGILLMYNFFLYTLTRESLHLVYAGLVLALIAFHAQLRSLGVRLLWPEWVEWNGPVLLLTSLLATYMLAFHAERFLQLESTRFPLKRIYSQLRWLCLMTALLLPWSRTEQGVFLMLALVLLTSVITFFAVIYCYRRDDRPLRWFAGAWLLFFVGITALTGNKLAWLPFNLLTDHALSVFALLGMLMISMAMSERNNQRIRDQLAASDQVKRAMDLAIDSDGKRLRSEEMERTAAEISLRLQTESSERLLREMDNREEQIEAAAQQLRDAARIDAQTAAFNRAYFNLRLKEEFERASRSRQRLGLLLIGVGGLEAIVQRLGMRASDDVLRQVAGVVDSVTRHHCANVYRYDENIFAVILPGISVHRTQAVAEMIRAAFDNTPFIFAGQLLQLQISVGIGSDLPRVQARPETLVSSAEQALDQAAQHPANALALRVDEGG